MLIRFGNAMSAVEGTGEEILALKDYLTFVTDDPNEEPACLLTEDGRFLSGLLPKVVKAMEPRFKVTVEGDPWPVRSISGIVVPALPGVELRDYQISMARKAIAAGRGVLTMATGSGKTAALAAIIKWYQENASTRKSLIVVNNIRLLEQTIAKFKEYGMTGLTGYSGGNPDLSGGIIVAMMQKMSRALTNPEFLDFLGTVDLLAFDEAHHLPAETWVTLASVCDARYRFGLSATPFDDEEKPTLEDCALLGATGPELGVVPGWVLRERGILAKATLTVHKVSKPYLWGVRSWHVAYKTGIVANVERNRIIIDLASKLSGEGKSVMVFVQQIEHGLVLLEALRGLGIPALFAKGGGEVFRSRTDSSVESLEQVVEAMSRAGMVSLVSPAFDEGIDVAAVNALIMAGGQKKHRRLIQRVGRGLRRKDGDNACAIHDFFDNTNAFLKRQSERRLRVYELERIPVTHER